MVMNPDDEPSENPSSQNKAYTDQKFGPKFRRTWLCRRLFNWDIISEIRRSKGGAQKKYKSG
jgi:hypothetical protein